MSRSLRTDAVRNKYKQFRQEHIHETECRLCSAPSKVEFEHWRIIPNDFPYDKIAEQHDMLIPKRHTRELNLNQEEKDELVGIKRSTAMDEYEYVLESVKSKVSIPEHYHLHIIRTKEF